MTNIVLFGDSWFEGCWDRANHLESRGIEFILNKNGYAISNFAKGGFSYKQILGSIKRNRKLLNDSHIYLVVTSPFRDSTNKFIDWKFSENVFTLEDLYYWQDKFLHEFLKKLNNIAIEENVTINLMGGLQTVTEDHIKDYSNLNISIESLFSYLLDCDAPKLTIDNYAIDLSKRSTRDLIDEIDNMYSFQEWVGTQKLFQPNKWHPNIEAHKIIAKFIMSDIPL